MFSNCSPCPVERPSGSPWSVAAAAKYLGISSRHLIRLIDNGTVKSFMLGRRRFIAAAELARVASGN